MDHFLALLLPLRFQIGTVRVRSYSWHGGFEASICQTDILTLCRQIVRFSEANESLTEIIKDF